MISYRDKVTILNQIPAACQTAAPVMAAMALRGRRGLPFVMLSQDYVYAKARLMDIAKFGMPMPGGGVTANNAYDTMTKFGIAEASQYTKGSVGTPNAADDAFAARHKITFEWRTHGPYRQMVKDTLTSGFATIVCTIIATNQIFGYQKGQVLSPPTSDSQFVGVHDMIICGMDETRDVYEIANNWGTNWGDGGFGFIACAYFEDIPNVTQAGGIQIITDVDVGYAAPKGNAVNVPAFKTAVNALVVGQITPEQIAAYRAIDALIVPDATAPPVIPTGNSIFGPLDTTTQGNWQGKYGVKSAQIAPAPPIPAGAIGFTWLLGTADGRALPFGTTRIAACWYSPTSFTIDMPNAGAFYMLDWDNVGRVVRVDALDSAGAVIATTTVRDFRGGVYLPVSAPGRYRFTNAGGPNAVVSGVFI